MWAGEAEDFLWSARIQKSQAVKRCGEGCAPSPFVCTLSLHSESLQQGTRIEIVGRNDHDVNLCHGKYYSNPVHTRVPAESAGPFKIAQVVRKGILQIRPLAFESVDGAIQIFPLVDGRDQIGQYSIIDLAALIT